MSALAHMIEARGVATAVIGLVRPHLETTRPPRALFVPFELGRPLGEPEDAAFQDRVLAATLSLLERDDGAAVLEDFAEDAPGAADNLAWRPPFVADGSGFAAELTAVLPRWRDAVARRGRTTVGLSGLPPEAWPELVAAMLADAPPGPGSSLSLRYLADDLKALYGEVAQPPGTPAPSSRQLNRWLFGATEAGRTLVALRAAGTDGGNEALRTVARFMVPVPYLPGSRRMPPLRPDGAVLFGEASMLTRRSLGLAAAAALARPATAQSWPPRDLTGIIMWGAGGATDVVARALTPHVEAALGAKIVLQNRPGGVGAIATQAVHAAPADGLTLLYGAENPQLHKVLGLAQIDYADFFPVTVIARGVGVIVANKDKPWADLKALVDDITANPGRIRMGSTGPGGLPHVIGAMLNAVTPVRVIAVPFDGEGPGLTALQGGHVDFMPVGVAAAAEHVRAGRVKPLAVVNPEPVASLPGVPPVTAAFPGFARYLPWGPFYGVWVKRATPAPARSRLVEVFRAGASNAAFTELMARNGNVMMNIAADEADAFLKHWQSVTSWLLQDAGATKRSPEEFGIPRP